MKRACFVKKYALFHLKNNLTLSAKIEYLLLLLYSPQLKSSKIALSKFGEFLSVSAVVFFNSGENGGRKINLS
ncbi:MAG: hypothetical protein IJR98_03685 [Synergistaceae bacterium]|nr:hypothetical protein [Synergistaceae bacterium]